MTNDPMDRFDKLLKAMVEGEPPKGRGGKSKDDDADNKPRKSGNL